MKKPTIYRMGRRKTCLKKILITMKLILTFLLINLVSANAVIFPQDKKLNLKFENVSMKEIFSAIEEQTNYRFLYNEKLIENHAVSIDLKNSSIDNILLKVLFNTGNTYRLLDNNLIVIAPENIIEKQQIIVKGTITDRTGSPLPGVNIVEKGTTNGTVSDISGNYSIPVNNQDAVLVISFLGYTTQEVNIGGQTNINITMDEQLVDLDEVVVVGYGTVKKSDITGSVASIGTKDIEQGRVFNPLEAMQGRAAGVDITSNSRPGEVGTIRIRGERSIGIPGQPTAANDPLFVVDGIPMAVTSRRLNTEPTGTAGFTIYEDLSYNPISDINPNDIESIEVLKDASATAIYGSRAANGVVLITTKRGKTGKTKITYDASLTFDKLDDRVELFGAADQFEVAREVGRKSRTYATPYADPANDWRLIGNKDYESWQSIAMGYEWVDEAARIPVMRPTTAEEEALWGVNEVPVYNAGNVRENDWMKEAVQTGITQNHQIGASAGTEKINSYFSFGYLDQQGIEKGQSYKRYSALISIDMQLTERIKLGGSLNGIMGNQEFGINTVDLARGMLPFAVPYDTAGNFEWLPGGESTIVNFMKDIENVRNNRKSYRMRGSFFGEVNILKGLKYRINFGPEFRQFRNGSFQSAETSTRWGSSSYARYFQDQSFNWTLENLLYYNKTFGVHAIDLTLLQSAEQYTYEYSHVSAEDLTYNEQLWYDLGSARTGVAKDYGSNYEAQSRESFMARVNYGLMDKYLLTVSGRYDGASVLAEGNKWQFFPAVAVAWKLQEEQFIKNISVISESKIRIGWGITGNSVIPPYQATGSIQNQNYTFGPTVATGYKIASPSNAELNWERTAQFNIGYDFGFFSNRLRGSIDVYNANTYDLLMDRTIPVVNGSNHVYFNIGKVRNNGIEIMLSTVNVSTNDFSWRTDFTFSRNKNQIVELYNGKNDDIANRWFIGEPINVNYGYLYDGIWQNTSADSALYRQYFGNGAYNAAGSIRIKDIDTTGGEHVYNSFDQTIRGSGYPDFISGITNYIRYKGIEFSFFLYARVGQTIGKGTPSLYGRYHDLAVDYWTPTNTAAEYPRPQSGFSDTYMSSLGYQKGSFLKVRNITLKYELPRVIISKAKLSNLSVRVQLLNPFLFTKAVNTDPDYTVAGNNPAKSFVVGINVGF